MKRLFLYDPDNPRREGVLDMACEYVRSSGRKLAINVTEPKRSLDANACMWVMLSDVARQVKWPVDGKMQFLTPEDWKHVISAGLKREQRIAQGIEGGFVILGQRTSQMSSREHAELRELIAAFGAEHGVVWTEKEQDFN